MHGHGKVKFFRHPSGHGFSFTARDSREFERRVVSKKSLDYSMGAQFNHIMNSQKESLPLLCLFILAKTLSMSR